MSEQMSGGGEQRNVTSNQDKLEKTKEAVKRREAQFKIAQFLSITVQDLVRLNSAQVKRVFIEKILERKDLIDKVNHKKALTVLNDNIRELYFAGVDAGVLLPEDLEILYPHSE